MIASIVHITSRPLPHESFVNENIDARIAKTLLSRKDSPTIVKRRFIEEYFFTKLLEVYERTHPKA